MSDIFRTLLGTYDFTNDDFIRTTEPRHKDAAQALEDATEDEASQASGAKQLRSVEKSAGRKPSVQLEVDEVSEEVIRTTNRSFAEACKHWTEKWTRLGKD